MFNVEQMRKDIKRKVCPKCGEPLNEGVISAESRLYGGTTRYVACGHCDNVSLFLVLTGDVTPIISNSASMNGLIMDDSKRSFEAGTIDIEENMEDKRKMIVDLVKQVAEKVKQESKMEPIVFAPKEILHDIDRPVMACRGFYGSSESEEKPEEPTYSYLVVDDEDEHYMFTNVTIDELEEGLEEYGLDPEYITLYEIKEKTIKVTKKINID